jgi:serine protease Do
VTAVLPDGREFDAELSRVDEARQLALLKIDGGALPFLAPVSSDSLQVADTVIALGNPFKIAEGPETASAHQGIVMLRTNLDAYRLAQEFDYHGPAIIIDAMTANPGAPGGPLLDVRGRFVGLVGKIIEASGTKTRLNYAVPGEELLAFIAGDAPTHSAADASTPTPTSADKPYLGITMTRLGFRHVAAFVERVAKQSPADQAGVRPDDLIIAVDGRRVGDAAEFESAAAGLAPGRTVQLTIRRGEEVINVDVLVGARP